MDNYRCAIVYGDNDEKRKELAGTIELFGDVNENSLHVVSLLDLAQRKFSDIQIFKQLNIHHPPSTVSFFFTELGHAIFLNTSIDDLKMGMLFLPKPISKQMKESLYKFVEGINDFNEFYLFYNLKLDDGLVEGDQLQGLNEDDKPIDILNSYFELEEVKNKAR